MEIIYPYFQQGLVRLNTSPSKANRGQKKFEVKKKIMNSEDRIKAREQILSEIHNARLDRMGKYTRVQAVAAVTTFLYRLYDYYGLYDEKEIPAIELVALLSNLC